MSDDLDRGYNGNINLKRKGIAIEWDADSIKEYLKCANDPIYFAERYINIVHVDHGFIPIELYDYQKDIIEAITNSRRVAVNTSRQAGKTTTAVVVILHYALFNEHKTIALLANKGDAAREILDRIKIAYEALPKWLQQGIIEWNKGSVEFENGCKIIAGATSSSAIRGKSISFLYIDETAFIENWDEFFASVFPTISSGNTTKILFTSTPNGLNHFYKICDGAQKNQNGYEYIEVPWQRVPGRDENWRKETLAGMNFDTQKFSQEFECEFQGSSGTLISGYRLKQLVAMTPIRELDGIKMYKAPEKNHSYCCVVDVSRGKGLDYSAFHIIDITKMPYNQVCSFRSNLITPADYAEIIYRTCKGYNESLVLVEVNDIGAQVSDMLFDTYEYENIIYTINNGRAGKMVSTGFGSNAMQSDRGVRTTKSVKAVGCSVLKLLVEQEQLIINDLDTINELKKFSKKGTSYEAENGSHDDMVMSLVLFAWLSSQRYFSDFTDNDTMNLLRDRTQEEIEESLLPFGFIEDGNDEVPLVIDEVKDNWFTI